MRIQMDFSELDPKLSPGISRDHVEIFLGKIISSVSLANRVLVPENMSPADGIFLFGNPFLPSGIDFYHSMD